MTSNDGVYTASSEKEHRNQIEAGQFVYRVKEHLKEKPDDFNTFKNILVNHQTGQFNELVLYIIMYAFLYSTDALYLLKLFQAFMPDTWSTSDLEWLHSGIEAAQVDGAHFLRLCARASSRPADPAPPSSSKDPTDKTPKAKSRSPQAVTSPTAAGHPEPTPTTPSKFGVHNLHRPLRPSPLRTSTLFFPDLFTTPTSPFSTQEISNHNIDARLRPTWKVPSSISSYINYDKYPEPSPLSSPLLSEEEKQKKEVLMRHVKRALDAQGAVFLSDEKRAQGLEELRAITEVAIRKDLDL